MSRLIEKLFERLIVRKLVVGGSTSEHLIMHEKKNTIIYRETVEKHTAISNTWLRQLWGIHPCFCIIAVLVRPSQCV